MKRSYKLLKKRVARMQRATKQPERIRISNAHKYELAQWYRFERSMPVDLDVLMTWHRRAEMFLSVQAAINQMQNWASDKHTLAPAVQFGVVRPYSKHGRRRKWPMIIDPEFRVEHVGSIWDNNWQEKVVAGRYKHLFDMAIKEPDPKTGQV